MRPWIEHIIKSYDIMYFTVQVVTTAKCQFTLHSTQQ